MQKLLWVLLLSGFFVLLVACSGQTDAPVQVEIISLDHAPIRPAVQEAVDIAKEFGDAVVVQSYDFDTPEGAAFAEAHNLTEHTPIAIFVNGEMEFEVNGRSVTFSSFPQSSFPQGTGTGMVAEGEWTMADLRSVLAQETN